MLETRGTIKRGLGSLIGNSGEYYVVAELLKQGVVAGLAPRNAPAFDIIGIKDGQTVMIRVKTRSGPHEDWQWSIKPDGEILRHLGKQGDFTVLVHLTEHRKDMRFWIVPSKTIDQWLRADFHKWVTTPGAKGQQRSRTNKKRHLTFPQHQKDLAPYEEAWQSLWSSRKVSA